MAEQIDRILSITSWASADGLRWNCFKFLSGQSAKRAKCSHATLSKKANQPSRPTSGCPAADDNYAFESHYDKSRSSTLSLSHNFEENDDNEYVNY